MVAARCSQATAGYLGTYSFPWSGWSGGLPQVGDRAIGVFAISANNNVVTPPAGWSALAEPWASGASGNEARMLVCTKELVAGDIGVTWTFTNAATWYTYAIISVYTPSNILTSAYEGSSPTNYPGDPGPYNPANYGNFFHPALTLSKAALVVLVATTFRNVSNNDTTNPFGNSVGVTTAVAGSGASATYMSALVHHVQKAAGAVPRYQIANTNYQGSWAVGAIALVEKNALPVATVVSPNGTAADPRNALTLDWNYSDTEGSAQAQSQVRYRIRGTSTWTELAAVATATSDRTWAAGTSPFTLGTEYEWAVRVNDGTDWGDWSATAWFMAGVDIWHYSAETTTATQATTIPNADLTPGVAYIFQVKTADAEGFGPWSANGTFTYTPYQTLSPTGIASAEAFGNPTVVPGPRTLSPTGIPSEEAFGTPTLQRSIVLSPGSIASEEAFGNLTIYQAMIVSNAGGIASLEAFGTPVVVPGPRVISQAGGIASEEAFGTPYLATTQFLSPTGIPSDEAVGTPTLTPYIVVSPGGIATEEAFGAPILIPSDVIISVTGIASAEAFGIPFVQPPGLPWIFIPISDLSVIVADTPEIELIANAGSIDLLPSAGWMEIVRTSGYIEVVPVEDHIELEENP